MVNRDHKENQWPQRQKVNRRRELGYQGELIAANYLTLAGCEIVARNVRTRLGELDIVAKQGELLIFVEVKTRSTDRFGTGAEAVDRRKQDRLRRLAEAYLMRWQCQHVRFDVIDILLQPDAQPELHHIPDAF